MSDLQLPLQFTNMEDLVQATIWEKKGTKHLRKQRGDTGQSQVLGDIISTTRWSLTNSLLHFLKNTFYLPALLGSQRNWLERTESFQIPPTHTASPTINIPHQSGALVTFATLTHHCHPKFTLRFTLGILLSVGLDKCLMARIYHYSTTLNTFTALKMKVLPSPCTILAITDRSVSSVFDLVTCDMEALTGLGFGLLTGRLPWH